MVANQTASDGTAATAPEVPSTVTFQVRVVAVPKPEVTVTVTV